MGIINSYFPIDRIKIFLSRHKMYELEYFIGSFFGIHQTNIFTHWKKSSPNNDKIIDSIHENKKDKVTVMKIRVQRNTFNHRKKC